MNKRGQIIELFGVLIILGIAVYGASVVYLQKENVYVGDTTTHHAYKYSECKEFLDRIPGQNLVVFPGRENIISGYNITGC